VGHGGDLPERGCMSEGACWRSPRVAGEGEGGTMMPVVVSLRHGGGCRWQKRPELKLLMTSIVSCVRWW
jgi:hypothetical protein